MSSASIYEENEYSGKDILSARIEEISPHRGENLIEDIYNFKSQLEKISYKEINKKEVYELRRAHIRLKENAQKYSSNDLERIALDDLNREIKKITSPKPYEEHFHTRETKKVRLPEEFINKGLFSRALNKATSFYKKLKS